MIAVLRMKQVTQITGLSSGSIYRLETSGSFPKRFSLSGGRAVAWLSSEVESWINNRSSVRFERNVSVIGRGKPGPGRGNKRC